VFSNILQILRNGELEGQIGSDIGRMVTLARESVIEAGKFFWGQPLTVEDRLKLHGKAEAISDIEHTIRNLMLVHLPLGTSTDRAHFLGLVNLLREIERLGERAKNLVDIARLGRYPLPKDGLVAELETIRDSIERMLIDVPQVLAGPDVKAAQRLTELGRDNMRRCEEVIQGLAASNYAADQAVSLALGSRIYARIQRQLLNLLSSVIIPLHMVDFFEERGADDQAPSSAARRW
jgi:phosphate uptake regulator